MRLLLLAGASIPAGRPVVRKGRHILFLLDQHSQRRAHSHVLGAS